MKRTFLALFMIAIMALTVCGAVTVTTQKAAAQPTTKAIAVNYRPGAKYIYTPIRFNDDWAGDQLMPGTKHFELATGGYAYSSILATQTQSGASRARVGTWWQLKLPSSGPYSNWNHVAAMPCKVTVNMMYVITAKSSTDKTEAVVFWGPVTNQMGEYASNNYVFGNDPVHTKGGIATQTWHGTVNDVFVSNTGNGFAGAEVWTQASGAGQASGRLFVSSIVLEFPAS